jgi:hypothetical protein
MASSEIVIRGGVDVNGARVFQGCLNACFPVVITLPHHQSDRRCQDGVMPEFGNFLPGLSRLGLLP